MTPTLRAGLIPASGDPKTQLIGTMPPAFRATALTVFALCLALSCGVVASDTQATENAGSRYLVLVSIDGFRWDYLDQYPTPALHELAERGVRAEALVPVFPTLTFPNHYSIATGLFPQNHGIVANVFPNADQSDWYIYKEAESAQDGSWYGGVPIWVAAHRAGLRTAAFFFPGTEAPVQGVTPDRWYRYDKSISGSKRLRQVLDWLAEPPESRPHMITLYFDDVDDHSHWSGVGSRQAKKAIARVDGYIRRLVQGIDRLPYGDQVTLVVVSDHGQGSYLQQEPALVLDEHFDIEGFQPIEGGNYLFLHTSKADAARVINLQQAINEVWTCGRAWRPADAPQSWQVGPNPRFPELILVPDAGCAIASTRKNLMSLSLGDHGWAPGDPDMQGLFIVAGPGIPAGLRIPPLRNVDVYPLLLRQLGIVPDAELARSLDSNLELWPGLLGPKAAPP
jgi:predicted AlkP superfamily pyrophosphatase or phosphodiesterase